MPARSPRPPTPAPRTLPRSCGAAGPRGVAGWPGRRPAPSRVPPHSPLSRRRGLGPRAAEAEPLPVGRPALAAPPGHGPARALSPLCLNRCRRRSPGLTGSEGFERVSSGGPGPRPGPWEGSGVLRAASPRVGCGRPLAGAQRAHSPARGAGRGARATAHEASGRCAQLGPMALRPPGCGAGAGRPRGAAPLLAARPGSSLRSGRAGPRPSARSLAPVSRPPAGQGARSRAGSAGNWPPVGDICITRPRPARPHLRGGTRPAATPPPLHLSAGSAGVSRAVGQPSPGEASLRPAPPPRPRGRRPRPAPALSLRGYTAHTAPGVYPGAQLPGGKGERAGKRRARAHLRAPRLVAPSHSPPAGRAREPRGAGPGTAPDAQQVAVQALGPLARRGAAHALQPRPGRGCPASPLCPATPGLPGIPATAGLLSSQQPQGPTRYSSISQRSQIGCASPPKRDVCFQLAS